MAKEKESVQDEEIIDDSAEGDTASDEDVDNGSEDEGDGDEEGGNSGDDTEEKDKKEDAAKKNSKKNSNWQQKRFGELTTARNKAQQEADRYKLQNEDLLAKLAAKNTEKTEDGTIKNASEDEINKLAEEKAKRMLDQALQQREINRRSQEILDNGAKDFEDFDDSLTNLKNSFGDKWDSSVDLLVDAIKDAHKVIYHLGTDLDEANRVLSLSPAKQIAEFTRIEMELNKPPRKSKEISKLPDPIKPVTEKSKHTTGLDDTSNTEAWIKKRNAQIAARNKNK